MKTTKIFLILLAAALVFSYACDELLGDLLKFDTETYTLNFTIEPTDTIGFLEFSSEDKEANVDSILEANGIPPDRLKSARVSDVKVTILTEGCTFDPVSNVELSIETTSLGSTRLAWLDPVPRDSTTVILEITKNDLQEYLQEDKFTITVSGTLNSIVDKTVDLVTELKFIVRGSVE